MLKNLAQLNGPGALTHPQPVLHVSHALHVPRILRRFALAIGVFLFIVVALQLVYPAQRTLPKASFGGFDLSAVSQQDVVKRLALVDNKVFTAKTDTNSYLQSLGELGISLNTEKIAEELANYPFGQRLIPFSILFYKSQVTANHLVVRDESKLKTFADKVAEQNNRPPIEGNLANTDGDVVITRSIPGRDYRAEDIANYFSAFSNESLADEALLPYSSVAPINSGEHLEAIAEQARTIIEANFAVTFETTSFDVEQSAIKQAVQFKVADDKKVVLDFDKAKLMAGLETAADGIFLAPGSDGAVGHELDRAKTADDLAAALSSGQTSAPVAAKPLNPNGGKLYAATSNGLQQLIQDWKASHASLEPAIAFAEIGGANRHANLDADTPYFSASVYKVFPAWYALDQIDKGQLDPNGAIAAGMKLDPCFQNMIIVSASECSEAIVAKYGGWKVMDEFIASHDIRGITLSSGVSITANGMTEFLHKLDGGELLSAERTNYLLDHMKRQKYRTGFPAGSAGEVADKVGYQPRSYSWHDAGIVYHPNGKYTLVVLTRQGAKLPTLATLARQISDTLAR